jgi:hypothetical protein
MFLANLFRDGIHIRLLLNQLVALQFFVPKATSHRLTKSSPVIEFMAVAEGEQIEVGDLALGEVAMLEGTFFAASDAGLLAHQPNDNVECWDIG